jgi:hypothetical protein
LGTERLAISVCGTRLKSGRSLKLLLKTTLKRDFNVRTAKDLNEDIEGIGVGFEYVTECDVVKAY